MAKDTNRGIALENLSGIRTRIEKRFKKSQRAKGSGWSFCDLKQKIVYKSKLADVPIIFVNPKYTSQRCLECEHIEKANRKSQSEFVCVNCRFSLNADINAAINIRGIALVTALKESETVVSKGASSLQVQSSNP